MNIPRRQPVVWLPVSLTVLGNVATWLALFLGIPRTDDLVVLHYNIFFGVDLLDTWAKLFLLPGTALGIALVNGILAGILLARNPFLAKVLLWSSLLLQVIGLTAAALLVVAN